MPTALRLFSAFRPGALRLSGPVALLLLLFLLVLVLDSPWFLVHLYRGNEYSAMTTTLVGRCSYLARLCISLFRTNWIISLRGNDITPRYMAAHSDHSKASSQRLPCRWASRLMAWLPSTITGPLSWSSLQMWSKLNAWLIRLRRGP